MQYEYFTRSIKSINAIDEYLRFNLIFCNRLKKKKTFLLFFVDSILSYIILYFLTAARKKNRLPVDNNS